MGSRKMVQLNLLAEWQWRPRNREQTCANSGGRRRLNKWKELHENIYITICKIDSQREFAALPRELEPSAL